MSTAIATPMQQATAASPQGRRRWTPVPDALAALLLVAGIGLIAPLYMAPAYVPDEAWFRDAAAVRTAALEEQRLWRFIRTQENDLGYGAIYWIVYALLGRWLEEPIVAARWLALASMATPAAAAALLAWKHGTRSGWLAVALWFTFPIAWWTGKLTGPEVFSLAASSVGAACILWSARGHMAFLAGVALGLACGIKLTALPVVAFGGVFVILRGGRSWRLAVALAAGLVVGFVLANPFVAFYPKHFAENVLDLAAEPRNYNLTQWSLEHLAHLWWNTHWEWDAVLRGGFLNWGLGAPALAMWLALLWRGGARRSTLAAFGAAVVCATAMFFIQARYLGWYWFPTVALIPIVTSELQVAAKRYIGLSMALLLVSLACSQHAIRQQRHSQNEQLAVLEKAGELQSMLEAVIAAESDGLTHVVWCVPPEAINPRRRTATLSSHEGLRELTEYPAYDWIDKERYFQDLRPEESAGIVLYQPYRLLWDDIHRHTRPHLEANFAVHELRCQDSRFSVVVLSRQCEGKSVASEQRTASAARAAQRQ